MRARLGGLDAPRGLGTRPRPDLLDADRERMLVAAGTERALDELIRWHMPLVRSTAARYASRGIGFDDLLSEGRLGLVEAARRFDSARGVRFGTYAAFWVRAFVRRYARANQHIVQTPSTRLARKLQSALPRARRALEQQRGREVSADELANALGVTPEEVAMVDAPADLSLSTADVTGIFADAQLSPEDAAASTEERIHVHALIACALEALTSRERDILHRRFLADERPTLAGLGQLYGLSRERVRQVERRACDKLRTALEPALELGAA
ncbi:MAG: sigma-70 family RNA polymerase sigma factor [Polyangiaceae bacterium]|nr:sigma-70 family RNA polymerase sigma factor [Polyangiaceae bacterium]